MCRSIPIVIQYNLRSLLTCQYLFLWKSESSETMHFFDQSLNFFISMNGEKVQGEQTIVSI